MTTTFAGHLLEGDHASRPAFGDVPQGTLYACTTHALIYQSDGSSAWSTWATLGETGTAAHVADTTDAHDASSIGFTPDGSIAATDVQAAIVEVRDEATGGSGYPEGTSFPGGPSTNDKFYRTDLNLLFYYDGTRWLSTTLYHMVMESNAGTISVTTTISHITPMLMGGSDLWLVDYKVGFIVNGGTALGASHKWVGTLAKIHATTATTISTINIDSGASDTYRELGPTAIGALMNGGTPEFLLRLAWTKTGTPGTLTAPTSFSYRVVAA